MVVTLEKNTKSRIYTVENKTSHAPFSGIHGASATPENTAKTTSEKPVLVGQKGHQISDSQGFDELLETARQVIRESDKFANWRAEINASIQSATKIKKLTPGIGPKGRIIPSYDELVDVTGHEYLRFIFNQHLFGAEKDGGLRLAAALAQTITSYLNQAKTELQTEKSRVRKDVKEIIASQREQFCCRIDRSIRDLEAELREFRQLMGEIVICSNEAMRESVVRRFWMAIVRAKSEADLARADFEAAQQNAICMVRVAQLYAIRELSPLVMPSCGYYTPKYFAARYVLGEASIRRHLRKAEEDGTEDWMKIENLTFDGDGQWQIREQWVAEAFDEYLKNKTRKLIGA